VGRVGGCRRAGAGGFGSVTPMRFPVALLRRVGRSLVALLVGALLLAPQNALASGTSVWADCGDADGTVNHTHSQSDYTDALKNPPADATEYTDCLDQIRRAQIRDSQSGASGGGGTGGGGANGGGTGGSASAPSVAPEALSKALRSSGVDPAKAAAEAPAAPAPVTVNGEQIDLSSERVPSIASALSLPLPLAASAIVVLLSAGLPLVRYLVARFGGPPTGTTSAP
jgi:hypothetical protein